MSNKQSGRGINSNLFRPTASVATLQLWTVALSCCSKPTLDSLPWRFFYGWRLSAGLASVHSTLQLLYFSWVKGPTQ